LYRGERHATANERECRDVFTAVGDLGELALDEANVRLEAVILPHLDGEEVVAILLGLLTRGVLSEERFNYLLEVVKKV